MAPSDMGGLWLVTTGRAAGSGTARLGRALAFASSSVCLAWGAHVMGGGEPPTLWAMLVALVLLTRVAFGLASRERGCPALLAGVAVTQLVLHVTFLLTHDHVHLAGEPSVDVRMLAGHAMAAVIVALLLRRAEQVLWFVSGLKPRVVLARLAYPIVDGLVEPPPTPASKIDVRRRQPRPHTRPLGRSARRRGPPLPLPGVGPMPAAVGSVPAMR